jgi:hypothetical protein
LDRRKEIRSANKTSNKKQKIVANLSPVSVAPAAPGAGGDDAEPSGRPDGKKERRRRRSYGKFDQQSSGLSNGKEKSSH